jgi:HD-GYP domain-containing protein (c-di-GMP phosphodiesterase class II)
MAEGTVVEDVLEQEEQVVLKSQLEADSLYQESVQYVLDSIRGVKERRKPDLERAETMVATILDSMSQGPALLLEATRRDQDYAISTHSVNVAVFALEVAQTLTVGRGSQRRIGVASLLHEVGVIRLPEKLTQREGEISREDLNALRRRPLFATEVLEEVGSGYGWLSEIVGQVYEREDGSGSPLGLKGEEICIEAKIVGIADFFDACIHKRPYRKALTGYQALFELTTDYAKAFDEGIVKGLIRSLSLYPYNEYVVLDSGEIGRVVEINKENLSRPVVEVLYGPGGERLTPRRVDLIENSHQYVAKPLTLDGLPI